jgi:hypothetical protein
MCSLADGSVIIQSTSESVSSTPSWFGDVTLMAASPRTYACWQRSVSGDALHGGIETNSSKEEAQDVLGANAATLPALVLALLRASAFSGFFGEREG